MTSINAPQPLTIWAVCDGEPTAIDEGNPRLLRMGVLCASLAERGHKVVYWTSRFDHLRKVDRLTEPGRVESGFGYKIHCVDRISYRKNVSLRRLRHNKLVAREMQAAMYADPIKPDIIVADLPTLELAEMCTAMGTSLVVPTIVNIRDTDPTLVTRFALARAGPLYAMARTSARVLMKRE